MTRSEPRTFDLIPRAFWHNVAAATIEDLSEGACSTYRCREDRRDRRQPLARGKTRQLNRRRRVSRGSGGLKPAGYVRRRVTPDVATIAQFSR